MTVSSFFGLQTSLRGLLAHQRALDVTGHNVANASVHGYSRQEAVMAASTPLHIAAGARQDGSGAQLGAGVDVVEYRRIRDAFLDVQFRAQAGVLGDSGTRSRALEGVELAFAEPGENGLAHQLQKFWSAWSNVANDPGSVPARQALVDQARTVATAFADLDRQLATVAQQVNDQLTAITAYDPAAGRYGDIAALATELAQVGGAIRNAYAVNQTPNDLLDRRDQLLDRLSAFGSVSVVAMGGGMTRVFFGGGAEPLVDDTLTDDPATAGDDRVTWPQALSSPGGQIGALMALGAPGTGVIATYRADLAAAASALATQVNALHVQGDAAQPFFGFDAGLGAGGLSVLRTPGEVATGRSAAVGDNGLALEIAALRGGAADSAYGALVARVGSEVRQAQRQEANAQVLSRAVDDRRQSAAGVSLDEEMTNLIRFQRGYQASARTMSTVDEMLDTLINRTGRVGL
jgi:flagellar hook-associated protein 1